MSLIDTGWTLSVGDGVSARTSTSGSTKTNWISTSTRAVSPALTSNAAESLATKPGRVAWIRYLPGGISGNVTCPAPSVVVLARTVASDEVCSSTWTPGIMTVPSSVETVAMTRPVAGR